VFRLIVVLFCVMCVVCVLCLIVVPLPPGKNPFAVKINKCIYKLLRLSIRHVYVTYAVPIKPKCILKSPDYIRLIIAVPPLQRFTFSGGDVDFDHCQQIVR
jgi:hypothetical protein